MATSCAQNPMPNIVENQGITTAIHQANVGKITFMADVIPLEEYQAEDFLSSFEIQDNSDLNIRAFFGNSLSNYLHQLAPSLTIEELVSQGNYQFSFYIDEDLLYTENLHPGAGLPHQKNKYTSLRVPLLSSRNEDSWGRFLWMRFYYRNGGEAALEKGSHQLRIEIRPYLQHDELLVGDIIAQGEIALKLKEPTPVSEAQIAIQPIQNNSGWELSKAHFDQQKIRDLNEKIAQNKFKQITSIVVAKDGQLLLEEYFNGASRASLHNTRSVGKSFASTMAGIAIEEAYLKNVKQTLSSFYDLSQFANYVPKKDRVTLKSLLTMSSGFDGNDNDYDSPGNEEKMYPTDDWIKFALELPMDSSKQVGKSWDYFTAGAVLLGDIIDQSVPGGLEKYTDEKLFQPLGISNYKWSYTPQQKAHTAGGLQMNALDFAKYGQVYKNGGQWKGKQIIPAKWVKESLTNHFADNPNQTAYGYLFWHANYVVNGKSYEAFQCSGNGGNKVIIFMDQPLVIVITATAYGQAYGHPQVKRMLEEYILPAVLD